MQTNNQSQNLGIKKYKCQTSAASPHPIFKLHSFHSFFVIPRHTLGQFDTLEEIHLGNFSNIPSQKQ